MCLKAMDNYYVYNVDNIISNYVSMSDVISCIH